MVVVVVVAIAAAAEAVIAGAAETAVVVEAAAAVAAAAVVVVVVVLVIASQRFLRARQTHPNARLLPRLTDCLPSVDSKWASWCACLVDEASQPRRVSKRANWYMLYIGMVRM